MPTITPPFQRRITNPLQRPLASDLNLQAFYDSVTQAYLAGAVYSASPGGNPTFETGFIGNSFRCVASTTSREVVVQKGLGFINTSTAYDEDDISGIAGVNAGSYAPVVCQPDDPDAAGISLLVTDLGAGLDRIDVVCVKSPNEPTDVENIGLLNPTSSTFSFQPKPTQFTENAFDTSTVNSPLGAGVRVITGTASAGTPTVPTIPSGYLEIARIYVPDGSGNLANSDIEDRRPVLIPHGGRAMTLEFDARLDGSTVQGFDFGNNGVHAVVRSVYETPPSSGYKYFEVYVSSGSVNPSVFRLNAAGLAIVESATITDTQIALTCGVKSRSTVTRASALPIFEAAGTFDALIGPTVAKFIVMAGKAYEGGGYAGIDINATNIDNFIVPPTVRLNLYAQAF
jgi:hypothetical protein